MHTLYCTYYIHFLKIKIRLYFNKLIQREEMSKHNIRCIIASIHSIKHLCANRILVR